MAKAKTEPETVVLGGRRFRVHRNFTLQTELYWLAIVHEAALHRLRPFPEEPQREYSKRVLARLLENNALVRLIAAVVVPEGELWSEAGARDTAEWIEHCRFSADGDRVRELAKIVIATLVTGNELRQWELE